MYPSFNSNVIALFGINDDFLDFVEDQVRFFERSCLAAP